MASGSPGNVLGALMRVALLAALGLSTACSKSGQPSSDEGAAPPGGADPVNPAEPPGPPSESAPTSRPVLPRPPHELPYINPRIREQGVLAPGEPKWDVQVRLEQVGKQRRFHFTIREEHGWAANGIYVAFWHQSKDLKTGEWIRDSRETRLLCHSAPLRFGQTLEHSAVVAAYEFPELAGFGTSENWAGTVCAFSDLTAPK